MEEAHTRPATASEWYTKALLQVTSGILNAHTPALCGRLMWDAASAERQDVHPRLLDATVPCAATRQFPSKQAATFVPLDQLEPYSADRSGAAYNKLCAA